MITEIGINTLNDHYNSHHGNNSFWGNQVMTIIKLVIWCPFGKRAQVDFFLHMVDAAAAAVVVVVQKVQWTGHHKDTLPMVRI
jgi:hypothetical protein